MDKIIKKNKSAILWLSPAHFFNDIYTGFLNPLMPFIAAKLGFTISIATILIAITQICSNLFQPIFGFFADNMLKRFFIFWGLILSSIFIPLAPSANNIIILTLFMILGSLGSSFFHPQSMGFVNYFSGKNCADNMGFFISMGSLGFAFGPLIASFIAQTAGLEHILYTSLLGIALALMMFKFVPKLSTNKKIAPKIHFKKSFSEILQNKQINYLMIIAMMKSLVTNSSCILLPFLWKSMDYSPFYIGFALFLFVFSGSIGSFISPRFEKIIGSKPIIYISLWATFPLMIAFAIVYKTMPIFSMIIFGFMGFITMLAQPVIMVWSQKTLPEYKSIISGFINGFCWGIIALFMSLLGFVAQKFGIINILVILTIMPILASFYVKRLKNY